MIVLHSGTREIRALMREADNKLRQARRLAAEAAELYDKAQALISKPRLVKNENNTRLEQE